MLQGLYAASSGMEAQQMQLDAVSNDLANLDTPGYQSTVMGFKDLLYSSGGGSTGSTVTTGSGAAALIVGRDQAQGSIQITGRSLDVAIGGHGYLQFRRPDGSTALSRDGVLELDAAGRLTNQQGMPLSPPITLARGVTGDQLKIAPDGTVSAGARRLGRISVMTVAAPNNLLPAGNTTFTVTAASGAPRPAPGATLQQGALEGSNVSLGAAMANMMTAERSYQLASQAIKYQDQMLQIANGIIK